jgi:hypothetical protein
MARFVPARVTPTSCRQVTSLSGSQSKERISQPPIRGTTPFEGKGEAGAAPPRFRGSKRESRFEEISPHSEKGGA